MDFELPGRVYFGWGPTNLEEMPQGRFAQLLRHFSQVEDDHKLLRVARPLAKAMVLVANATIAACDDCDEIVAGCEHHPDFLERFTPVHYGIPASR